MKEKYIGKTIAVIGDSITAENLTLKHVIRAYKRYYGDFNVRFFNCGVAGGTAEFAVTSFDADIARYSPTHAVIAFGINDSNREALLLPRDESRYAILTSAFEVYKKNMRLLVARLLEGGVDVTLCTPVPYDEYAVSDETPLPGGSALMLGYAEFVRLLAKDTGVRLYDQHRIISGVMASEQVHSSDRIHPTPHGYYVLARELLSAQGIDIGREEPLPDCFDKWHSYVARLRKVLATECMIVHDFDAPLDSKMTRMRAKVENEDWGKPVFESFIRAYVADKESEADFYRIIDELYESDIM